jgi:hypothetical protein
LQLLEIVLEETLLRLPVNNFEVYAAVSNIKFWYFL